MQLEAAKHLAAILSEDERIINSKDPHFTHLFLVPESADPYAYVNSVLAWGERGAHSVFKVHYPPAETKEVTLILVSFSRIRGYGSTFDVGDYLPEAPVE